MPIHADDFARAAADKRERLKAAFRDRLMAAGRKAMDAGQDHFTVPADGLPVGLAGPTPIDHPYQEVLDEWRDAMWLITEEPAGRNERQLVFRRLNTAPYPTA